VRERKRKIKKLKRYLAVSESIRIRFMSETNTATSLRSPCFIVTTSLHFKFGTFTVLD
jgi:hypothetical protein